MIRFIISAVAAVTWLVTSCAHAADTKPTPIAIAEVKRDKPVEFAEVHRILAKNCLACHSGTKAESSLVLESPDAMRKGGDNGPSIVSKKGAASLLIKLAAHQEEPVMPPADNKANASKLTPEELGLIKLWIDQGATGQATGAAPLVWQSLPTTVQPILAVAMTGDGQLAAAGRANELYVYEIGSGRELARLIDPALSAQAGPKRQGIAHLDMVHSLAFNPSGDLLASGGYREVKLWRRPRDVRRAELTGLAEPAQSVAVSADGKWAATGETNGTIRLWDLATGKHVHALMGHTAAVTGLRFAIDNAKLFSSSKDKTLRAWNIGGDAAAGKIDLPAESNGLALVNDGTQLVSADGDNLLRVWPLPVLPAPAEAPKPLKEFKGHSGPVNAVDSVMPAGKVLISGSQDGTARVWNYDTAAQVRSLDQGGPVIAVAARGDGKRFASGGANTSVKLWNAENGQIVIELKGDFKDRFTVARLERATNLTKAKAADRKKEITEAELAAKKEQDGLPKATEAKAAADKALADKTAELKKPQEAKEAAQKELDEATVLAKPLIDAANAAKEAANKESGNADLKKKQDEAQKLADATDVKLKAAQKKLEDATKALQQPQRDQKVAQNAAESAARNVEASHKAAAKAAEAVPAAKQAAEQADAAQQAAELALEAGKKATTDNDKPPRSLAFSSDNLQLMTGHESGLVQVWSAETGAPINQYAGQGASITAAVFTTAGNLLTAAANNSLVHWDTQPAWKLERTIGRPDDLATFQDRVLSLDFSPDGKLLLTAGGEPSRSGEIKIWNVADGTLSRAMTDPHSDSVFCARFSPEGDRIASAAADRFVKLWNTADGSFLRAFEGHTHHVLAVAWRLDGKMLVTGSADNSMKVWDTSTGEQKRTIQGPNKEFTSLMFAGDGPRVIASLGDNSVRLFHSEAGNSEKSFGGSTDFVYSAATSADGKWVTAGGQDGVLRVWSSDTALMVRSFAPAAPGKP